MTEWAGEATRQPTRTPPRHMVVHHRVTGPGFSVHYEGESTASGKIVVYQWESRRRTPYPAFWEQIPYLAQRRAPPASPRIPASGVCFACFDARTVRGL